jgi:hypothetical protein
MLENILFILSHKVVHGRHVDQRGGRAISASVTQVLLISPWGVPNQMSDDVSASTGLFC